LSGGEKPEKVFFRIGEAAELIGVETHVLRYWESEFKMKPRRSETGHRLYRRDDVGAFLRIKKLLHDEGFTIAGARRVLDRTDGNDGDPPPADEGRIREAGDRVRAARTAIATIRKRLQDHAVVGSKGSR
jgi:DNA-binding transcriptional MerR regulator